MLLNKIKLHLIVFLQGTITTGHRHAEGQSIRSDIGAYW